MSTLLVDTDISAEENLFGKTVADLQSDIVVGDGAISGTLIYQDDYTGFSPGNPDEQVGYYLALHFVCEDADSITVEVVGGVKGPVALDEDGIAVFRIADKSTQTIQVVATAGENSRTLNYSLTGLTLQPE